MGDTATIILAMFLGAILMFGFPLLTSAEKTDDVAQLAIQEATTEYANKIKTTAYITQEDYDNFVLTLAATGNAYDVEIEVEKLDANPAKKHVGETTTIGDSVYYKLFTTQVLADLPLALTEGDIVSVSVKNTNTTIAGQLRNFLYKVSGNGEGNIAAQASGIVTKTSTN